MITPLNPSIPVVVVGNGTGECIGWIDYGPEHHLLWIVAMDSGGEVWQVPNHQIRLCRNPSMMRHWKEGKGAEHTRDQSQSIE